MAAASAARGRRACRSGEPERRSDAGACSMPDLPPPPPSPSSRTHSCSLLPSGTWRSCGDCWNSVRPLPWRQTASSCRMRVAEDAAAALFARAPSSLSSTSIGRTAGGG
eukprot:749761-Hanusia_phi.AAC.3